MFKTVFLATLALSSPQLMAGGAQQTFSATMTAVETIDVTQQQPLAFGELDRRSGTATQVAYFHLYPAGSVVVNGNPTGTASTSIGARFVGGHQLGRFLVSGEDGRAVTVTATTQSDSNCTGSAGGNVRLTRVLLPGNVSSLSNVTLDATVIVGGTLAVLQGAPAGDYSCAFQVGAVYQ